MLTGVELTGMELTGVKLTGVELTWGRVDWGTFTKSAVELLLNEREKKQASPLRRCTAWCHPGPQSVRPGSTHHTCSVTSCSDD